MKTTIASTIVLALSVLASGYAAAGGHGGRSDTAQGIELSASLASTKTSAEVQAEFAEAQRTGDIVANGSRGSNSGKKLNELYPDRYPAKPAVQAKTSEQVLDELAQAKRNGELFANKGHGNTAR